MYRRTSVSGQRNGLMFLVALLYVPYVTYRIASAVDELRK